MIRTQLILTRSSLGLSFFLSLRSDPWQLPRLCSLIFMGSTCSWPIWSKCDIAILLNCMAILDIHRHFSAMPFLIPPKLLRHNLQKKELSVCTISNCVKQTEIKINFLKIRKQISLSYITMEPNYGN